jgi:putative ABC transport system ATP-binding protein
MSDAPIPAIEVSHVSKSFGQGQALVEALKDVSLEAFLGEMFFLVGPSGCGKTTLLSILCSTLKPTSGSVRVFGTDLTAASNRRLTRFRREHVGFVFQQFNLIPTLTITENVSVPLLLAGKGASVANRLAKEALDRVGLRWQGRHASGQTLGRATAARRDRARPRSLTGSHRLR